MTVQDFFSAIMLFAHQAPFILIKWALLGCLLAMLSVLFYSENFKLPKNPSSQNNAYFQSLYFLAKKRGWYALILFCMYIVTVIIYDIALYRKGREVVQIPPIPEIASAEAPQAQSHIQVPQAQSERESGGNDIVSVFDGVTVFSERNAQTESYMDKMKQRYEPIFITYFILEHCKLAGPDEFIVLQDKILDDLGKVSGSSENLTRFIDASRGSYEEMYSQYDCSKPELTEMKSGFYATIKTFKAKPGNAEPDKQ